MGHYGLTVGFSKDLESKDFAFVFVRVATRQRREPYAGKGSYNHSPTKKGSASLNYVACLPPPSPRYFERKEGEGWNGPVPSVLSSLKSLMPNWRDESPSLWSRVATLARLAGEPPPLAAPTPLRWSKKSVITCFSFSLCSTSTGSDLFDER